MTTAAKRARKKANKAKGWPEEHPKHVTVKKPQDTTESAAAAARMALAKIKKMRESDG